MWLQNEYGSIPLKKWTFKHMSDMKLFSFRIMHINIILQHRQHQNISIHCTVCHQLLFSFELTRFAIITTQTLLTLPLSWFLFESSLKLIRFTNQVVFTSGLITYYSSIKLMTDTMHSSSILSVYWWMYYCWVSFICLIITKTKVTVCL